MNINVSGNAVGKAPKQRPSARLTALASRASDNALAIIGVVTSVAGFVGLLTSGQLRALVRVYPYPVCVALIITLFALLMSLHYAQVTRQQRDRLQARVSALGRASPSGHDARLLGEVLADLPPGGPVIAWIRRTEATDMTPGAVPADVVTALDRTIGRLADLPVGFDDEAVARALAELLSAIEDYRASMESWTVTAYGAAQAGVTAASFTGGRLAASRDRLLAVYQAFLLTAHQSGLDATG